MKKGIIKSLILSSLIIMSIYQVITLWFDNVSDRNFFYSVINQVALFINEPENEVNKEYMINPRILGVYLGASDKDFTIIKRDREDYKELLTKSTQVITKVVEEGKLEGAYEESDFLWEERGLVFSLSMPMSKETLAGDLNVDTAVFGDISYVNSLGIIPASDKSDQVKVYLITGGIRKVYVYSLAVNELREQNNALMTYIEKVTEEGFPAYISSLKNDIELFSENVLLPIPSNNIYYYNELSLNTPYIVGQEFQIDTLEKYINQFFDNPNVKWMIQNNDVMIYGDDNALIKYNKNGLLEYSGIQNSNNITQTISSKFNVAEQFLKKDFLLENLDYYLQHYEEKDGKTTFYYRYNYDHLPIHLDQSVLLSNKLTYPMEVTVEKGKVVKYKRLLIELESKTSQEVFKGQFEKALNQFVDEYKVSNGQLEDMYLGYVDYEEQLKLMWVIKSQGKYYWIDLN